MSKTTVVISCPIDTYSGYGARARDFVKALDKNKYEVKILSQRWGNTRFGYLQDHQEFEIESMIIPKLTAQPDVWIQVTVPNEFQKVGKFNIGLTAGMETDISPPEWVQGCNNMDLILVSSEHGKASLVNSKYDVQDKNTGTTQRMEVTTPVEVLFEGVDLEKYFTTDTMANMEINLDLDNIQESFCYLFVGHWLQGGFGHDRKNVGWTIKAFLETFKNKKQQPALILKTQHANASITDRDNVLKKINEIRKTVKGKLPNIYVVHGELSDDEVNELYNHSKVKAMVNFTKGEGFGRPLLEFSLTGKPIIASGWSGHIDFLNREFTTLVGGTLHQVDNSAVVKNIIMKEAKWFQADEAEVGRALKDVFDKYKKYEELGKRQRHYVRTNFSLEMMAEKLDSILSQRLPEFPKQVKLELPKLQLPKLQKI
ncbi:glycosyltransferase [bacterium]|nr:glycosyltransferase [bacterium]